MDLRPSARKVDEMREISIKEGFTSSSSSSIIIAYGNTKVLCSASIENRVPSFLKGSGSGWVTAEYGMLPSATTSRNRREAVLGNQSGRTVEIQRLIGRSLRSVVSLEELSEITIVVDCDVLSADGGTRTASITGGYIALSLAIMHLLKNKYISKNPLHGMVAAISVGIYKGVSIIDLDYAEDSAAETDMNIVMNDMEHYVEIQGTAEGHAFSGSELTKMLKLAKTGVKDLLEIQRKYISSRELQG